LRNATQANGKQSGKSQHGLPLGEKIRQPDIQVV
jgi:hypothetical protein